MDGLYNKNMDVLTTFNEQLTIDFDSGNAIDKGYYSEMTLIMKMINKKDYKNLFIVPLLS